MSTFVPLLRGSGKFPLSAAARSFRADASEGFQGCFQVCFGPWVRKLGSKHVPYLNLIVMKTLARSRKYRLRGEAALAAAGPHVPAERAREWEAAAQSSGNPQRAFFGKKIQTAALMGIWRGVQFLVRPPAAVPSQDWAWRRTRQTDGNGANVLPELQPIGQMQPASQIQVTGRVTYARFLETLADLSVTAGWTTYPQQHDMLEEDKIDKGDKGLKRTCGNLDFTVSGEGVIEKLVDKNVAIDVHQPEKPNPFLRTLGDVALPLLTIAGLLFLCFRGGGAGGIPGLGNQGKAQIMTLGHARPSSVIEPETGVKFDNVAGIDEAKEELMEILDFLKAPERFVKVGAKIPRGVLLTGPPGTGKTLKALAGEAGVSFIESAASEFIELFGGVGASRVCDILKQAKEKPPCIVFIDEIDAIGRQRGALNQMLC
eukprot:s4694_g2.t1